MAKSDAGAGFDEVKVAQVVAMAKDSSIEAWADQIAVRRESPCRLFFWDLPIRIKESGKTWLRLHKPIDGQLYEAELWTEMVCEGDRVVGGGMLGFFDSLSDVKLLYALLSRGHAQ